MSANDRVLLTLCTPWMVAIPIQAVVRVLTAADLGVRPAAGDGALLGTVADRSVVHAAWDLARLLGLRAHDHQAWVLLNLSPPIAIRTGPCLSVVAEPAACPLPAMLTLRTLGLGCFVRPVLPVPDALQAGLAPIGLRVEPTRLFSAADLAASRQAIHAAGQTVGSA